MTMMNMVGIVEGNVTDGEIKNGTGGKKRVLGSVTRMIKMTVITETGPAAGDINHAQHQKNGIVMRSTGKTAGDHHLPREPVLLTINIEDIEDTMRTTPKIKDDIQAVLLLHVVLSHEHSPFQSFQSRRKGRDQHLYLIMIVERPPSRRGI